ncbi:hypothetical protein O6H91_15G024400 [Diphasiastrum complanatum]|uniref:Uncharacterized protein n=1 Tax=Diphasiastrum complanatum TaxID=34168 RepID=A0ACC2BGR2_DIPCM|nr:hypothetical protein O6H91_15G024400 [Diphasiastrum complanatum]
MQCQQLRTAICSAAAKFPPLPSCCLRAAVVRLRTMRSETFQLKAFSSDSSSAPNWADTMLSNSCKGVESTAVVLPAVEAHAIEAASALRNGQVIALPTDTLYGLACDACSATAIQRIYAIKGRNVTSPLAVCVADVDDIKSYGTTSYLPEGLLRELLPGPVTVILQRGNNSLLDKSLNPGILSIGVRIPDSDFIRLVARSFGGALALTSANLSGQPSTIEVREFEQLWSSCALIFDTGRLVGGRLGSTIVDLTRRGIFKVVRKGSALMETKLVLNGYGLIEET